MQPADTWIHSGIGIRICNQTDNRPILALVGCGVWITAQENKNGGPCYQSPRLFKAPALQWWVSGYDSGICANLVQAIPTKTGYTSVTRWLSGDLDRIKTCNLLIRSQLPRFFWLLESNTESLPCREPLISLIELTGNTWHRSGFRIPIRIPAYSMQTERRQIKHITYKVRIPVSPRTEFPNSLDPRRWKLRGFLFPEVYVNVNCNV